MGLIRPRLSARQKRNQLRAWLLSQGSRLGWEFPYDYHQLTTKILKQFRGRIGNGSPLEALRLAFPNHTWHPFLMPKCPDGFWSKLANRRSYLRWLEQQLGINSPEDWYKVVVEDFVRFKGSTLINFYYYHPIKAAQELYPKFDFKPWMFNRIPREFYKDAGQVRRFIEEAERELKIRAPEEWAEMTSGHHALVPNLNKFIDRYGSIWQVLRFAKPEINWKKIQHLSRAKWKHQQLLFKYIKSLYPRCEIENDFWCREVRFAKSKRFPQIDVYVEKYKLGFEYQGGFHRRPEVAARDREKFQLLKSIGIKLIIVPESWNGQLESLRLLAKQQGIELPSVKVTAKQVRELKVPDAYSSHAKKYQEFVLKEGRHPTHSETYEGFSLGAWASAQRQSNQANTLSYERKAILQRVGFLMQPRATIRDKIDAVIAYVSQRGRWPTSKTVVREKPLGTWIQEIRRLGRSEILDSESVRQLDDAGFDWGRSRAYDKKLELLSDFVSHCGRLPGEDETFRGLSLGKWLYTQKLDRLRDDKLHQLLEIADGCPD